MSDELRDKIADILENDAFDWDLTFQYHKSSPEQVSDPGPLATSQAQAIIDSLNLVTYESETHTHVAGKWEKK